MAIEVKNYNPPSQSTLSARLKQLLNERDLSISRFAQELGVSRQTAHKWLKDGYIHPKSLAKIASHLDASYNWLSLGTESGEQPPEYNPCKECDLKEDIISKYRKKNQALLDLNFHLQTVNLFSHGQLEHGSQIHHEPLQAFIDRISPSNRNQFHSFYQGLQNKKHETLELPLTLSDNQNPDDYLLTTISICGHHCALIGLDKKTPSTKPLQTNNHKKAL